MAALLDPSTRTGRSVQARDMAATRMAQACRPGASAARLRRMRRLHRPTGNGRTVTKPSNNHHHGHLCRARYGGIRGRARSRRQSRVPIRAGPLGHGCDYVDSLPRTGSRCSIVERWRVFAYVLTLMAPVHQSVRGIRHVRSHPNHRMFRSIRYVGRQPLVMVRRMTTRRCAIALQCDPRHSGPYARANWASCPCIGRITTLPPGRARRISLGLPRQPSIGKNYVPTYRHGPTSRAR